MPAPRRSTSPAPRGFFRSTWTRSLVSLLIIPALAFLPMRRAEAFVAPAAAPVLITASGPVVWSVAALAALVAAGIAVLAVRFKDSGGTEVLDVQLNDKYPQRVPSGWTAASPAYSPPVPPGTAGSTLYWYLNGTGQSQTTYTSKASACSAWAASISKTGANVHSGSPNDSCWYDSVNGNGDGAAGNIAILSNTACPTGYGLVSGVCTISAPLTVPFPSDGVGRKKIASGAFADDSRDPDNALPSNVTAGSTQVKVKQGTSTTTIDIGGDGSVTVKTTVGQGNGTSLTTQIKLSPPSGAADGGTNAVGVAEGTVTGEGESTTETPATTCAGGPCATEATQTANKALLQDMKDNGLKLKEQAADWSTPKAAADTKIAAAEAAISEHKTKLDTIAGGGNSSGLGVPGLANWSAPSSGEATGLESKLPTPASCQALSLSFKSHSFNLDICPVINAGRVVIEWGLYLLTITYIFLLYLRPREVN